jgi:Tfp pilus assembly protein PilO
MNKLSKEKRNQLIMIVLGTAGVIAGLWFVVISAQLDKIHQINGKIAGTVAQIEKMQQVKKTASKIEEEKTEYESRLSQIESTMPSGDWYLWVNNTLRQFNNPGYHVDIPVIGAPVASTMTLFAGFPYNQLDVAVNGSAYYDDLGRFLADFENHFPCMRIENLSLEPGNGPNPEDREKLTFHMDIISLTKVNPQ